MKNIFLNILADQHTLLINFFDSKFFNETNKKVIGKMKYEFGGVILSEFVRLKSKMYSKK